MKIKKEYSDEELFAFTEKLIVKSNAIHLEITKNKDKKVINPYKKQEIFKMSQNGYNALSEEHSFFDYKNSSIKKSIFSLPLSYMGFGGYLNPFTNEAQVNDKLPMYGFPMVVCHEMAHQIGYASESECNFIGFLAASSNENLYFQYAAYTMTLRYCLRNIEVRNKAKLPTFLEKINSGILANYKESELFWQQYESPIENGFKFFYDKFLKMNHQKDGLKSYSKFLNLLINYHDNKKIKK